MHIDMLGVAGARVTLVLATVLLNTILSVITNIVIMVARLNLTSKSKIKGSLFFKMFIYMYKKDFSKKNIFFFALTGRPEAIYFAL